MPPDAQPFRGPVHCRVMAPAANADVTAKKRWTNPLTLRVTLSRIHPSTTQPNSIMTIKRGDQVKIKPEWQDAGDDEVTFVAVEDEDGGRVRIAALGVLNRFNPTSVVLVSMLEAVQ